MAAAALLALAGCDDSSSASRSAAPPPPTVTVSPPLSREIVEWDEYTGQFAPVEFVEVRARVSGYLQSIHFEDGQVVDSLSQSVAAPTMGTQSVTEFHVTKPSGWPAGRYTVDVVTSSGQLVGRLRFSVTP